MRKAIFCIALTGVLLGTSCSKDDDKEQPLEETSQSELVGTWYLTAYIENGDIAEITDECEQLENFNFKSDNTYSYTYYQLKEAGKDCQIDEVEGGTWEYMTEKTLEIKDEIEGASYVQFDISGSVLTLTYEEGESSYQATYERQ